MILLASCGDGEHVRQQTPVKDTDTVAVVMDTLPKKISGSYNRIFNDIARYLAGMDPEPGCMLDSSYLENKDWKQYAENAEKKWHLYDSSRIQVLKDWSRAELAAINSGPFTLFYPFSGPDILHADCFYPEADTTVMIGLEPVGTVPFTDKSKSDTLAKYFASVTRSLYAILHFSFFRTEAMKKDLRTAELNGTTPLMMIFLQRTGNRVLDVKYIHIDSAGRIAGNEPGKSYKSPGVEITYCHADNTGEARLFYFSTDLSNEGLTKTSPAFLRYLYTLGYAHTYLKSASYLMYNDFFSEIRSLILKQSLTVLQDDSGIPHRFFTGCKPSLYGKYSGVISLFKGNEQKDLDSLFKSLPAKPLDFGIGYKWHKGESNLVLYECARRP